MKSKIKESGEKLIKCKWRSKQAKREKKKVALYIKKN